MAEGLSDAEKTRLKRLTRTRRNAHGRRQSAVLPFKMARTSGFVPRGHGVSSDTEFLRICVVRSHAVVELREREVGTRHRDALAALFRLRVRRFEAIAANGQIRSAVYRNDTTWHEILIAFGLTAYVNNLLVVLPMFEELQSVTVDFFTGSFDAYGSVVELRHLAGAGWSNSMIGGIKWSGVSLRRQVSATYGERVHRTFEAKTLESISAEVYFRLKGDFAEAWWFYVDSHPDYNWSPLETWSELIGRNYRAKNSERCGRFREGVKLAFQDMIRTGGISKFELEGQGPDRRKPNRVCYTQALPKQDQLVLAA